MSDQERLAMLLREDGYQFHGYDLSKSPKQEIRRAKPIPELIEIAEEMFLDASWTKKVGKAVAHPYYYVEWHITGWPHRIHLTGDTKQEAELRCAIAALEKLKEKTQ